MDERANTVRDRFGLIGTDAGTLVYVGYPTDFSDVVIPTAMDANSGCYFYVSPPPPPPPPPCWGLTCSLQARYDGMKEGVHLGFDGLTDNYESEIIGDITRPGLPDVRHLLNVALSR